MKKLFGALFGVWLGVIILCMGVYAAECNYCCEDCTCDEENCEECSDVYDYTYSYRNYISVYLNGEYMYFNDGDARVIDSSVYVPMREMFENLGADVLWDSDKNAAIGTIGDISVEFTADESEYKINGEEYTLNSPTKIIEGKTYVPVRALCEAFNCSVEWKQDGESFAEVYITYLRPLSEDEQYLYDCLTDESYKTAEISSKYTLKCKPDNVDISIEIEALSKENKDCALKNIKVKGDIYRGVLKIDADIDIWREVKDGEVESFYRINGGEDTAELSKYMGFNFDYLFDELEKNETLYAFFNNLEVKSVKTDGKYKIYSFEGEKEGISGDIHIDTTQNRVTYLILDTLKMWAGEFYTDYDKGGQSETDNSDKKETVCFFESNIKYTDEVLTKPEIFNEK